MKLSIPDIDEIELRKRYEYHKLKKETISKEPYMDMFEKGFKLRQENVRFNKSLNGEELKYIHNLVCIELTGEES